MNRQRLEWMKEQIDKLDTNEHTQIHGIVQKYTENITKAPTGIFVSSEHLPVECLQEMEKYVLFCIDQKARMDEDLKTRKTYERMVE
jgi:hypothetical protein